MTTDRSRNVRLARVVAGVTAVGSGIALMGIIGSSDTPARSSPSVATTAVPPVVSTVTPRGDGFEGDDNEGGDDGQRRSPQPTAVASDPTAPLPAPVTRSRGS